MMYLHQLSYKRKLLLVILFYTIFHFSINAQDITNNQKEKCFWIKVGMGTGTGVSMFGLAIGGNISYQYGVDLWQIRSIHTVEAQVSHLFDVDDPEENFWDVGILYGKNFKSKYLITSLSIGIGFVSGIRRGRYLYTEYHWLGEIRHYEKLPFYTAGIPIEAQISWIPTSFWGMGITAFANLNRRNSVVGILLSKSFGKLK